MAFIVPYKKVQQERVCSCLFYDIFKLVMRYSQSMGTAKPSFVRGLQDEYEAMGVKDAEHEEDMIALGGMVFTGQQS